MLDEIFTYSDLSDVALTEAEEVEAIAAAQAGDDDATMTLIRAYGPALRSAVSNFANGVRQGRDAYYRDDPFGLGTSAFTEEDVQGRALIGFMLALREHDPAVSPRLAGRIRQRLARELADLYAETMPFAVPERTLSRFYGILRAADGDVEKALASVGDYGMSPEVFREVYAAVRMTESLEGAEEGWASYGDGGRYTASGGDEVRGSGSLPARPIFAPSPIADAEDRILCEVAFEAVDDEEERICRLSYGFTEYEPVPDAEIGHRMGLTRPTVQRKRGKALGKMRKALGASHV